MKCENQMELTFPSQSRNEGFARAAVAAFAAQLDPNLDELGDIKTAVSEAVTNCIVHAYRDTIGTISLKCRILPGSILDIIVKDRGCGITDVAQARTPMYSTGGDERSGMGFTDGFCATTAQSRSAAASKSAPLSSKRSASGSRGSWEENRRSQSCRSLWT